MEQRLNGKSSEQYWLNKFSDTMPEYDLPWENTANAIPQNLVVTIPVEASAEINRICKASDLALLTYFTSAISLVLGRYLGRNDIAFSTTLQNQRIPVKIFLEEQCTYQSWLQRNGLQFTDSLQHLNYSYNGFIEKRRVRNSQHATETLTKIRIEYLPSNESLLTRDLADLDITVYQDSEQFTLNARFKSSVETYPIVEFFLESCLKLILGTHEVLNKTTLSIDILSETQKNKVLREFNSTNCDRQDVTYLDLFEHQTICTPDARALIYKNEQITYSQLNERAGRIAYELHANGVAKEEVVVVLLNRSIEMVPALLGVLKSGGAFLPIDPDYPNERIEHILRDSGARFVVSEKGFAHKFKESVNVFFVEDISIEGKTFHAAKIHPRNLAYVIYTSGTTGVPNGVMIEHEALVNLCQWHNRYYHVSTKDISTKYAGFGFDATIWEIFPPLVCGSVLYVVEDSIRFNIVDLNNSFLKHGVTISFLPTQFGEQFMTLQNSVLRKLLMGGDKLRIINENTTYSIYNNYGPTENTVVSTAGLVLKNSANIPIGRPIDNTNLYILSATSEHIQPIGVPGELHVSGKSLARGYLGNESLTKLKFITSPIDKKSRLYKTGDLARWLPDGNIEFLGRSDSQIKIRGYRIEPEEIEKVMLTYHTILDAAVVKKAESESKSYLCAYYTSDEILEDEEINSFLQKTLPTYMIPSLYVRMDVIPVTSNGKVDRVYLSNKDESNNVTKKIYVAPENEVQKIIADVWQNVLGVARIGIEDNFFLLGGDSIMAMQIESRLLIQGYKFGARGIFDFPTIRELSKSVTTKKRSSFQGVVSGQVPLTPIQFAFFNNSKIVNKQHYNQAIMLEFSDKVDEKALERIFTELQQHHDALRMTYKADGGNIIQENRVDMRLDLTVAKLESGSDYEDRINAICSESQQSINIEQGPLMKLVLFQLPLASRVAIIVHHLVIDGISWRIILEDIAILYDKIVKNKTVALSSKTDSFKLFSEKLVDHVQHSDIAREVDYWNKIEEKEIDHIFNSDVSNSKGISSLEINFTAEETQRLLSRANLAYNTNVSQLLIAGLANALNQTFHAEKLLIWLEGHGREKLFSDSDISRTVGWFTSMFPFYVEIKNGESIERVIVNTKDSLNRIPQKGIGYGILKHLSDKLRCKNSLQPKGITFNYLGQFDHDIKNKPFRVFNSLADSSNSIENGCEGEVDVVGMVVEKCLHVSIRYNPFQLIASDIERLAKNFKSCIDVILEQCGNITTTISTPSDFLYPNLSFELVRELTSKYRILDIYALSPAQEGMLFHSLLDPKSLNYYQYIKYDIAAEFNAGLLQNVLSILFDRHDILRTFFLHKNLSRPVQVVLERRKLEFRYLDLADSSAQEVNEKVEEYKIEDSIKGFNLANDTLLRLCVVRVKADLHQFIWTFHHIIMDGWCAALLSAEFHNTYSELAAGKTLQFQHIAPYKNYIEWLEKKDYSKSREFWKDYFKGFENLTPINVTLSKQREPATANDTILLDEDTTKQLRNWAATNQVTLNSLLQGVWAVILGRLNNTEEVLFGRIVSGRPSEIKDIEKMVGVFINTIPLRINVNADLTFLEVVKSVQHDFSMAEDHEHFPLAEIQKQTGFGDILIDHILAYENYPVKNNANLSGARLKNVEFFEQTNYDFNIIIVPEENLNITFKYNANVFEKYFVQSIKNSFLQIIDQVVSNPLIKTGDLTLVSEIDRIKILKEFNLPSPKTSEHTFLELFQDEVKRSPHSRALVYKDQHVTYSELEDKSNGVALRLLNRDVKKEQIIAIMLDKSIEMVISLIGILKSGAAFLPIDPQYPDERVRAILEDSDTKLIISERKYISRFSNSERVICVEDINASNETLLPKVDVSLSSLAYIIYTSGTTGVPNGVMIEHKALACLCQWHNRYYQLDRLDISTKYAGFGFDATIWEIFPVLISGGTLYITDEEVKYNVALLNQNFMKHGVTISFLPTPLGEQFMEFENTVLKKLLLGGDKLKGVNKERKYKVYNNYGPTENTVVSTAGYIDSDMKRIHIGNPVDTTHVYILSKGTRQLQPIGVPGELCVSGEGLARGYLGRKELTDKKFTGNPFSNGKKMYKTGDLAKWLPDGNIDFLGRIDQQVKVRGYRIELGEIENKLVVHEHVKECVVAVQDNKGGHAILVAFYTSDIPLHGDDLKLLLAKSLPSYMVPSAFISLDQFPINQNGKVDRAALSMLSKQQNRPITSFALESSTQLAIAKAWSDVLGISPISPTDNFFDLGGTSLDMIHVSDKLGATFNIDNLLMLMFKYPTVNLLAAHLEDFNNNGKESERVHPNQPALSEVRIKRSRQREKRRA